MDAGAASTKGSTSQGWLCSRCFASEQAGGEETWRARFGVPSGPEVQCCRCGELPPLDSQLAALGRLLKMVLERPARATGEAASSAASNFPKRRAYSLKETAVLLGVSLTKVKDEVRGGRLGVVLAGKRRRVLDAEINRYLLSGSSGRQ